jgi:hypothetical protein
MGTLSALKKRLTVGTVITKIAGCTDKGINIPRTINKVQTNGIYMDGSWLEFVTAPFCDYSEETNTFSFYFPKDGYTYDKGRFKPKTDSTERGELIGTYVIQG